MSSPLFLQRPSTLYSPVVDSVAFSGRGKKNRRVKRFPDIHPPPIPQGEPAPGIFTVAMPDTGLPLQFYLKTSKSKAPGTVSYEWEDHRIGSQQLDVTHRVSMELQVQGRKHLKKQGMNAYSYDGLPAGGPVTRLDIRNISMPYESEEMKQTVLPALLEYAVYKSRELGMEGRVSWTFRKDNWAWYTTAMNAGFVPRPERETPQKQPSKTMTMTLPSAHIQRILKSPRYHLPVNAAVVIPNPLLFPKPEFWALPVPKTQTPWLSFDTQGEAKPVSTASTGPTLMVTPNGHAYLYPGTGDNPKATLVSRSVTLADSPIRLYTEDEFQIGNKVYLLSAAGLHLLTSQAEVYRSMFPTGLKDLQFQQGKIGNCFFLAAVKALTYHPQGKVTLANLLKSHTDERVTLRLTAFPENPFTLSPDTSYVPNGVKTPNPALKLLEEAFGRLRRQFGWGGRSLSHDLSKWLDGGDPADSLYTLTGWPTEYYSGTERHTKAKPRSGNVTFSDIEDDHGSSWRALCAYLDHLADNPEKYIVTADTPERRKTYHNLIRGGFVDPDCRLLENHAFAVCRINKAQRTLTIVDPHYAGDNASEITLRYADAYYYFSGFNVARVPQEYHFKPVVLPESAPKRWLYRVALFLSRFM